jgi:hypothetical protein
VLRNSPADKVCHPTGDTRSKDGVPRVHGPCTIHNSIDWLRQLNLGLEDNGNNDTINGHSLTENDAAQKYRFRNYSQHILNSRVCYKPDQILRCDSRSTDSCTKETASSDEDTPEGDHR